MEKDHSCRERFRRLKGIVIIPAYNNAGTLPHVIAAARDYAADILVVNDGSTDATAQLLEQMGDIQVISYARNRGKGHALRLGLEQATAEGYRYAVTMDADGQHYPGDLPLFVSRIEEVPDSLLIGGRNLQADNMPSKNTFANRFSNFWFKVETGQKLSDTQSGYRLYPLERLKGIFFITTRYEFEVEIIVRAAWRGIHVENIPIRVYYPPAEERVSHFRPLQDFTRISILNTFLVLYALLCYYPWKFIRSLTRENIRNFIDRQLIHSGESNIRLAAAMGWGVFCGIVPIWGYQMIFAALSAHFLRLNKIVAVVFSNVSIPPMIPFILYGSIVSGAWILGEQIHYSLSDITLESLTASLFVYIVGSLALAAAAGIAVTVIGYLVLSVFHRRSHHA